MKYLKESEYSYFSKTDFSFISDGDFNKIIEKQRLKENVFRDECIFIYKLSDSDITMDEFEKIAKNKMTKSVADIEIFQASVEFKSDTIDPGIRTSTILEDIRDRVLKHHYGKDYTGIDEKTGKPVINKLVYLSEKRAFELRSNVYKNDVLVYNEFENIQSESISSELFQDLQMELKRISLILSSPGSFCSKMEVVCNFLINPKYYGHVGPSDIKYLPRNYRNYLNYLGLERIKALSYIEANILREISDHQSEDLVRKKFLEKFIPESKYTLKDIKSIISEIYQKPGITETPKATDLLEYFNVKEVKIYDSTTKKQSKGYLILSVKE